MVGFHSTVWVGNVGQLALVDLLLDRNYSDFLAIKILEVSRLQKLRRRDVVGMWWIWWIYGWSRRSVGNVGQLALMDLLFGGNPLRDQRYGKQVFPLIIKQKFRLIYEFCVFHGELLLWFVNCTT